MPSIDQTRKVHLAMAEAVDAWRIIPRLLVGGYAYLIFKTVDWYMNLHPYLLGDHVVEAPTTQHAALVTAVVGVGAAVFGLYTNSGKKWNGFTPWSKKSKDEEATGE